MIPKRRLDDFKWKWLSISQFGVWVIGIVTTFLVQPPKNIAADAVPTTYMIHFVQFVVALVIGLLVVSFSKFRSARHLRAWIAVSVFALLVSTILFFGYQYLLEVWTCDYGGSLVVKGSTLTPLAETFVLSHSKEDFTCKYLIESALGVSSSVWLSQELLVRHIAMLALYLMSVLSFAFALLSSIQAISIGKASEK